MKKPLFRLKNLEHTWGHWSLGKGEISLSRRLVLNYGWDSVREVLLHEMAHQFAHQVLGARNETAHGLTFLKACEYLRADPKASGDYPLLQEKVFCEPSEAKDKTLMRIKKLLALAESRNRYEAEAAMMKAHELIAKYNIDILSLERKRNYFSVFLGKPSLRNTRDAYHLAHLIQDFYYVHGIWVPSYVMNKGKMGTVLEISGTRQNIAMASYVYDFVNRFIRSQWDSYSSKKGLTQHRKTDYAVGIIEGFRETLTAQQKKPAKAHTRRDVVPVDDHQLMTYAAQRYPYTRSFRRTASRQDESVLADGITAGKKLILHKGISEKRKGEIRLIQAPKDDCRET